MTAVVVRDVLTKPGAIAVIHLKAKKINGERVELIVERKNDGKSDWL